MALSKKAFERANLNWLIDFTAAAGALTRMRPDTSADAGQGIGIAREAVSFLKPAFRNQRHVASGIRMSRAGHHAREVRVQPIPIHRFVFKTFLHDVSSPWVLAGQPGLSRLRLLLQCEIG